MIELEWNLIHLLYSRKGLKTRQRLDYSQGVCKKSIGIFLRKSTPDNF